MLFHVLFENAIDSNRGVIPPLNRREKDEKTRNSRNFERYAPLLPK